MKRDDLLKTILQEHYKHTSWLDIGAGVCKVSAELRDLLKPSRFVCIDKVPPKNIYGIGCHAFDGRTLPFKDDEFDFSLINFVLHHAGEEDAKGLIQEAFRVSKYAVFIQEDLRDGTPETEARLEAHQPGGFYLDSPGWQQLLLSMAPSGWDITCMYHDELLEDFPDYPVPRALFAVEKVLKV